MIRNLTLALEDDLLLKARKIALERRTSVNQMIRDYLTDVVDRESRIDRARANLKRAFQEGIADVRGVSWRRDDLHER